MSVIKGRMLHHPDIMFSLNDEKIDELVLDLTLGESRSGLGKLDDKKVLMLSLKEWYFSSRLIELNIFKVRG